MPDARDKLGIHKRTWWNWLNGKARIPIYVAWALRALQAETAETAEAPPAAEALPTAEAPPAEAPPTAEAPPAEAPPAEAPPTPPDWPDLSGLQELRVARAGAWAARDQMLDSISRVKRRKKPRDFMWSAESLIDAQDKVDAELTRCLWALQHYIWTLRASAPFATISLPREAAAPLDIEAITDAIIHALGEWPERQRGAASKAVVAGRSAARPWWRRLWQRLRGKAV